MPDDLKLLRGKIDGINSGLLDLLSQRAEIIRQIGDLMKRMGIPPYDPERESEMLANLLKSNKGPFPSPSIEAVFKEIFRQSMDLMEREMRGAHRVSREFKAENTIVRAGSVEIGLRRPIIIAGPCAVENRRQMTSIAGRLKKLGIRILRGGAYKPRTSPYSFQGLRMDGVKLMKAVCRHFDMSMVTEVMDTRDVDVMCKYADILQIGARNMYNYELLRAVGASGRPVLLKRGFMATLEEFLLAAEYIALAGNDNIILCERGIRTFERWTRNTLDLSAVPILNRETHLPVIVDISHACGRRDILPEMAAAALAAGARGLMIEVHNNPTVALSDSRQQLNFEQFENLLDSLPGEYRPL